MADELTLPSSGPLRYLHITHCAFAFSDGSALVLVDPFMGTPIPESDGTMSVHHDVIAFRVEQMHRVDAVFVSHEHLDHYDPPTIDAILRQTDAIVYAPRIVVDDAINRGMDAGRFRALRALERLTVGQMSVTVHAVPGSEDVEPVDRVGFLIESGGAALFHQGDAHGVGRSWLSMADRLDAFIMWPYRVREVAMQLRPRTIILQHMDRFEPPRRTFFHTRDPQKELDYWQYDSPWVKIVVPQRGIWTAVK